MQQVSKTLHGQCSIRWMPAKSKTMEEIEKLKQENQYLHSVVEEQAYMLDDVDDTSLRLSCLSLAVSNISTAGFGDAVELAEKFYKFATGGQE